MALFATLLAMLIPTPDGQRYASLVPVARATDPWAEQRETAPHSRETALSERPHRRYRARHQGCNTRSCDKRMDRRARARTNRRWRRITRPYRNWLRSTRYCESGNDGLYKANTGNDFYGAYQFMLSTWYSVGGRGYPHNARPLEQDYRAVLTLKRDGSGAWPVCG